MTSVFAIHLWICWESINSINAARAICIFVPELERLSIMGLGGLGLLLVFVWHRWLQFISSSPHLYVEKLRIYQLIASYLHFCSRASAFVWHWCSQFISHMLRIYQLRASYLHFSSRAWGWVAWVAITDADVPMCHCVCSHISWETQKLSIFCCQAWGLGSLNARHLCLHFLISIKLEIMYGRHCCGVVEENRENRGAFVKV